VYQVEIDWAPPYELVVSLSALLAGADQKVMDLGPSWAREVRSRLRTDLLALLPAPGKRRYTELTELLVWQCPGERDVASFLSWLCSLSPGDLYERLAPHAPEPPSALPRDLGSWRDRAADLLSAWHEQYFQHIDPAILEGLRDDAEARRALIGTMAPDELVEVATNGVHYIPEPLPDRILLVPQWHFRPWNTFATFHTMRLIRYPVDALPPAPREPPPTLLRLTRVLGDESRLRILRFLAERPHTFTELVQLTGLSKSTVSHHMMTLRAAGLVRVIERGSSDKTRNKSTYELRLPAVDDLSGRLRDYLTQE
jgi:DNA-binding transcriptional ArsR family regulator